MPVPAGVATTAGVAWKAAGPFAKKAALNGAKHAAATLPKRAVDSAKDGGAGVARKQRVDSRWRRAGAHFAKETNGDLRKATFGDGVRRWVVFDEDGQPLEAFPPDYKGDLREALKHHDRSRLARRLREQVGDDDRLRGAGRFIGRGVEKASHFRRSRVTNELVEQLEARRAAERREAAIKLGGHRDPAAVPALVHALRDKVSSVRAAAADALGDLGDPLADKPLSRLLADDHDSVRQEAAASLGEVGGDDGDEELLAALESKDASPELRATAASALGARRADSALEPLARVLQYPRDASDREATVRSQAAHALALLSETEATSALVAGLRDAHREVRVACAYALGKLGSAEAIPAVEAAIEDPVKVVAEAAFIARKAIDEAATAQG